MIWDSFWAGSLPPLHWVRIQTWIDNLPDTAVVVFPLRDADCVCPVDFGAGPQEDCLRSLGRYRYEPIGEAGDWARHQGIETVEFVQYGIFALMPETDDQRFAVRMRWL